MQAGQIPLRGAKSWRKRIEIRGARVSLCVCMWGVSCRSGKILCLIGPDQ